MIEAFFDCSSPWTYLAFHNLERMAEELEVQVTWRPILVGGVFNALNSTIAAQRGGPPSAKSRYTVKDLAAWARFSEIDLVFPPPVFPVNSVKAMRGCLWLQPQGRLEEFARATFEAYWRDGRDISKDAVLADLCAALDIPAEAFFLAIASPAIKEGLRANTHELMARGGFGSPTVFVDGEMFFGNDRLPLVRAAILSRSAELAASQPTGA